MPVLCQGGRSMFQGTWTSAPIPHATKYFTFAIIHRISPKAATSRGGGGRGPLCSRLMVAGRVAAGLVASILLSACPAKDPSQAVPAVRATADEVEVDLAKQLQLDRRRFPLTVWAAHVVQAEYFDKGRLDPREQFSE